MMTKPGIPDEQKYIGADEMIAHLTTELARVKAERDAALKDAERYRWLRDQRSDDGIAIVMKNKHIDDAISYPSNIDNYIDAARSMEKS